MRKLNKNSCYSEKLLRILILRKPYFPPLSILSGWIHIIVQGCACLFYVNCELTFKKVKILCEAMIGLEKSFELMYSNTHLRTRETLPLILFYLNCKCMLFRGAVANFNIAQTIFTSAFNIVWTKPYHSTMLRLPVLCKLWTDPLKKKLKFYARRC